MNLATRIERLENAAGRNLVQLPDLVVQFIDVVPGANGRVHPGPCVKMLRMRPGAGHEWLDPAGNPIPDPA